MQRTAWFLCAYCFLATWGVGLSAAAKDGEEMVPRTYPVADLVVPVPSAVWPGKASAVDAPKALAYRFEPLVNHIKAATGPENWTNGEAILQRQQTLSLVIRQTPMMHARVVDELRRLRKEQDLQVCTELIIVTGPRKEVAAAVAAFPGELDKFEQEQFQATLQNSKTLTTVMHPKITAFNRQVAAINTDGKSVVTHGVIAADHRSIRLKIAYAPDDAPVELIPTCQLFDLHDGRAVVVRFEAPASSGVIPPADDVEECLVFVLPRIIVQEEEEELALVPPAKTR